MFTDQKSHKALTLLREAPTRFACQGTVTTSWRTYRGRRLGPYYRLAWRENGRQRSIYLGRQGRLEPGMSAADHNDVVTRCHLLFSHTEPLENAFQKLLGENTARNLAKSL